MVKFIVSLNKIGLFDNKFRSFFDHILKQCSINIYALFLQLCLLIMQYVQVFSLMDSVEMDGICYVQVKSTCIR